MPWPYRKFRQAVQRANEQQSCAPVHRSLQIAGFLLSVAFILFLFLRSRIIKGNQINSNARSLFVISGECSRQNSLICDHRFKFSERRLRFKKEGRNRERVVLIIRPFSLLTQICDARVALIIMPFINCGSV